MTWQISLGALPHQNDTTKQFILGGELGEIISKDSMWLQRP